MTLIKLLHTHVWILVDSKLLLLCVHHRVVPIHLLLLVVTLAVLLLGFAPIDDLLQERVVNFQMVLGYWRQVVSL